MNQELRDPFTYFETKSGIIGYSLGADSRVDDQTVICGLTGYFSPDRSDRVQIDTGRFVEKVLWGGNEGNQKFEDRYASLPRRIYDLYRQYTYKNLSTNEGLVSIPAREILKVYNGREALKKLLERKWLFSENHYQLLLKLINILNSSGIPTEDIGLYGSAQMGIFSPSKTIDIDVVLYGLDKYEKLKQITTTQKRRLPIPSKYQSVNDIENWRLARANRDLISTIHLGGVAHADVKIIRKRGEALSLDLQNIDLAAEIELEARVVDASESMSFPAVYKIIAGKKKMVVGTRKYVYLGAANKGDKVVVRGRKVKGRDAIFLADPLAHYIRLLN